MKPFELRLAHEHLKVARHSKNLDAFINDPPRFNRLPSEQRSLMLNQADLLRQYLRILEARLKNLGIPV